MGAPDRSESAEVLEPVRARARISGRVQGVFFRASAVAQAERIGALTGSVRNLADGDVEAVIQGPRDGVERMVAWLQIGPPAAKVEHVEVSWEPPVDGEQGFEVAG